MIGISPSRPCKTGEKKKRNLYQVEKKLRKREAGPENQLAETERVKKKTNKRKEGGADLNLKKQQKGRSNSWEKVKKE